VGDTALSPSPPPRPEGPPTPPGAAPISGLNVDPNVAALKQAGWKLGDIRNLTLDQRANAVAKKLPPPVRAKRPTAPPEFEEKDIDEFEPVSDEAEQPMVAVGDGNGNGQCDELPATFLAPRSLRRFKSWIAIVYVLAPIVTATFTGTEWFSDNWMPRNYYDPDRDILLQSEEVCDENDMGAEKCDHIPVAWKDKVTRRVFHASQFDASIRAHKHAQLPRVLFTASLYALVGALLYAYLTAQAPARMSVEFDFVRRFQRGVTGGAAFVALTVWFLW
jgi:hypothetical protein